MTDEFATDAVTIGRWSISERESASGITINDAAGRALARVPLRRDDLSIARAIVVLPELVAALQKIVKFADSEPDDGDTVAVHGANIERARAALAKVTP